jgi:prephenate dehydrogenase
MALIGTGLMGGSLGLAARNRFPDMDVVGWDDPATLQTALRTGAIGTAGASLSETVRDRDLVVICTPVGTALDLLREIGESASDHAVITDIGSVKQPIADLASDVLPASVLFVGGHPMTGSEKSGIDHADSLLYENSTWILTPPDREDARYDRLVSFLGQLGARIMELPAGKHDAIAARVSHLPQLLAILLVNVISADRTRYPELLEMAAGGFRDMTRIASSPFAMWRDILASNDREIHTVLSAFSDRLHTLSNAVREGDLPSIAASFHDAEQTRDFVPSDRKGFLHPLSNIYVFADDKPGALVRITTTLFDARINIRDIELLRIREGTGGTFRLGFVSPEQAEAAVQALTDAGIRAYRL